MFASMSLHMGASFVSLADLSPGNAIQSDLPIAQCNACHLSHYMCNASWAERGNSCDD
jgi:hypothetical protein